MPDEMSHDGDTELIDRVAAELRAPVRLDPALDARVMREVRAGASSPTRERQRSLWRRIAEPRVVRISPLAGVLAAAGIVALVASLARAPRGATAPELAKVPDESPAVGAPVVTPRAGGPALTQFVLVAPAASRVSVVGDFNDWDAGATPLARMASGGVWTVAVPLSAGRHVYTFVVDGKRWVSDPSAPADNDDDFGRPNSVVTVAGV